MLSFYYFTYQHGACGKLPDHGSKSDYGYLPKHCHGHLNPKQMKAAMEICGDIRMICGEDIEEDEEKVNKRAVEIAVG